MDTAERMRELRHVVVPEFVFGDAARRLTPHFLRNLGSHRVLVVTDPGVVESGWVDEILADIESSGATVAVFKDVSSNPRASEVMAGAEVYGAEGCDGIVSIGGGSPTDCAKGIGIVASSGRHITEFAGVDNVEIAMPPLICVSTTTTSADVSQFAIISECEGGCKAGILSKALVPDISLLDPVVYTTLTPELTAACGIDSLGQAIEAFVSNAHSPFTDLLALDAIERLTNYLPSALEDPLDVDVRAQLMQGNLHGGIAFSNASLGLVHATAHAVGALTDAHHGRCVSAMLRPAIDVNHSAAADRYAHIGRAMGLGMTELDEAEQKEALLAAIEDLQKQLGVDVTLTDLGITEADFPELVRMAAVDPTIVTNPRDVGASELEVVYGKAI